MGRVACKTPVDMNTWPRLCLGGCGRALRPPRTVAADFPNVRTAASQRITEAWCQPCTMAMKGKHGGHRSGQTVTEPEEVRLRRMRVEIEALVRDRRRRGVPPEGTLMPGEDDKVRPTTRKPMPRQYDEAGARMPLPRTPKLEETVSEEAPLGLCMKGHPFTRHDTSGRRVCDTCRDILKADRARRAAEATPLSPGMTCKRGHPYTRVVGARKYCPVCKARSRKKLAMRKAAAVHAAAEEVDRAA